MQAFTVVAILWLGAAGAAAASTSDGIERPDISESLPEEILHDIASLLPVGDLVRLSLTSRYIKEVIPDVPAILSAKLPSIVSEQLLDQFGAKYCLLAALCIENAPPGFILKTIRNILQSGRVPDEYVLDAIERVNFVGHCDILPVLLDHRDNRGFSTRPVNMCRDVARLAAYLPLGDLLNMHALPRTTFLEVLDRKYPRGYASFFQDRAWSEQRCSKTVMSHALHLYNQLDKVFDFKPFGRIASEQTISEETLNVLEEAMVENQTKLFSNLQLVLKPKSELEFLQSSSDKFRKLFLIAACEAGHLAWVKTMVEHNLWSKVKLEDGQLRALGSLAPVLYNNIMLFVDVLEAVDPVLAAFELVFRHQIKLRSSAEQEQLRSSLLRGHLREAVRQIVRDYE